MANNIGTISVSLSRTIGNTISITNASQITILSGYADVGFIAFDNNGTMGVCTSFTRDQGGTPTYVFRTCSLDTDIDIQNILSQSY